MTDRARSAALTPSTSHVVSVQAKWPLEGPFEPWMLGATIEGQMAGGKWQPVGYVSNASGRLLTCNLRVNDQGTVLALRALALRLIDVEQPRSGE